MPSFPSCIFPSCIATSSRAKAHRFAAALLAAGAATLAQAQPGPMPPLQAQGQGRFVCGGIGSDESTAFRGAMRQHPLSLMFSAGGGAYLSNVEVRILDASGGEAMSLISDGPICLIDLPPGRYTINATSNGATQRQQVGVGRGSRPVSFRF